MAIQPTPQQGINQYFKQDFQDLIQARFTPDEVRQFFREEGMLFYVSKQRDPQLSNELDKTFWRVQMRWHKDSHDTIDGIFLRATSENHQVAWIATNPNDGTDPYKPCFVWITKETIQQTLKKQAIPEDEHSGCPEIINIVLNGEKKANGSSTKKIGYCIAGALLLLSLAYFAKKYFNNPEPPTILPIDPPQFLSQTPTTFLSGKA